MKSLRSVNEEQGCTPRHAPEAKAAGVKGTTVSPSFGARNRRTFFFQIDPTQVDDTKNAFQPCHTLILKSVWHLEGTTKGARGAVNIKVSGLGLFRAGGGPSLEATSPRVSFWLPSSSRTSAKHHHLAAITSTTVRLSNPRRPSPHFSRSLAYHHARIGACTRVTSDGTLLRASLSCSLFNSLTLFVGSEPVRPQRAWRSSRGRRTEEEGRQER